MNREEGVCSRVKREHGILIGSEQLKGIWKSYFECLMNEETDGKAVVSSMGTEAGGDE